jgi:hypothetical protein
MLLNMDLSKKAAWEALPGDKCWVWKHKPSYRQNAAQEVDRIAVAIGQVLECDPPIVAPTLISPDLRNPSLGPILHLLTGLSKEHIDYLLHVRYISTSTISAHFLAWKPEPDTFLVTLDFLAYQERDEPLRKIKELVGRTLSSGEYGKLVRNFLSNNKDNFPTGTPADQALRYICDSVLVTSLIPTDPEVGTRTVYNIYAYYPSKLPKAHEKWVDMIQKFKFDSVLHGTGAKINLPFTCKLCRSSDHPTGKCPFEDLPGWVDTVQLNEPPVAPKSSDVRGRGRGRGGPRGSHTRGG